MRVVALTAAIAAGFNIAAPGGVDPAAAQVNVASPYAVLIEAESGSVLFERAGAEPVPPASLAKLMTAEVVFRQLALGKLKLDDEFTVSENAWRRGGAPAGGSTMFAPVRSRIAVRDLLLGLIVQSGNDSAIVLAEGIAGSETAFVHMMNARARELGLDSARFANASGLSDPDMRISVRDLARLSRHIVQTYPEYYRWYSERSFTWNKIYQRNRNPLLDMNIGADGLKTGYTKEAGFGLVGSAVQDGLRLFVAVNGAKSDKDRAADSRRLLEWGFRAFEQRVLFAAGEHVVSARVYGGDRRRVALTGDGAIKLMVSRTAPERLVARLVYTGPVPAPVEAGQPIGRLRVWRGDVLAVETPLKAAESVPQGGLTRRAFDAAIELVIGLFRKAAARL